MRKNPFSNPNTLSICSFIDDLHSIVWKFSSLPRYVYVYNVHSNGKIFFHFQMEKVTQIESRRR